MPPVTVRTRGPANIRKTAKKHAAKGATKTLQELYASIAKQCAEPAPNVVAEQLREVPVTPFLNFVPENIRDWCHNARNWRSMTKYTMQFPRPAHGTVEGVFFVLVPKTVKRRVNADKMQRYIHAWFANAVSQAPDHCAASFRVFLYLTPFVKKVPEPSGRPLSQANVNTAATYGCSPGAPNHDIIVYRWEEWFKVMVHESFHRLGLDDCTNDTTDQAISNHIFSHVPEMSGTPRHMLGVYEAYTETWAEIVNLLFKTYETGSARAPMKTFRSLLQKEQEHSMIQRKKVESYNKKNGLHYNSRVKLYSYYVIKQVLLQNTDRFVEWCARVNGRAHVLRKNRQAAAENTRFYADLLQPQTNTRQVVTKQVTKGSLRMTCTDLDWFQG